MILHRNHRQTAGGGDCGDMFRMNLVSIGLACDFLIQGTGGTERQRK